MCTLLRAFVIFHCAAAIVPALEFSGTVINTDNTAKSGVTVSLVKANISATTDLSGNWKLETSSASIIPNFRYPNNAITQHLRLDNNHLNLTLNGYNISGRTIASSRLQVRSNSLPNYSTRFQDNGTLDSLFYSWNGEIFYRDTVTLSKSGMIVVFDTTWNASVVYGTLLDSRDSERYRIVTIDTQTWMAENLNFKPISALDSSWCYGDNERNCAIYGRLYTWATAMGFDQMYNRVATSVDVVNHQGICPTGWHIPNYTEWGTLGGSVGSNMRYKLSSVSRWDNSNTGEDVYGFRILPAGARHYDDGRSYYLGSVGVFWAASTSSDAYQAWCYAYSYQYDKTVANPDQKRYGYSVRCLKDSN